MNRLIILMVVLMAGAASGAQSVVQYINTDSVRTMAAIRLCSNPLDGDETCIDLSAPCAPLATCSVVYDLAPGVYTLRSMGAEEGGEWSVPSNVLSVIAVPDPAESAAIACLADDVCRSDFDGDGIIGASDFARWFSAWRNSVPSD